jgi:multidrug efflux pump
MHSFWNFFLQKQQFTWLIVAALLTAGTYSVITIPKENAPEVIVPIGIVSTPFPGASAADVEELVTNKIEDTTDNLDNVNKVTSRSQTGFSVVVVEFNASADVDTAIEDLKNAVDSAKPELPDDANDPQVSKVNFADQPVIVFSVSSDALSTEFTKIAKDVEREIEEVSGVSRVDVSGAPRRETQVVVDPALLQNFGLGLSDVILGIASQNATLPIGTITTGGVEYALQFDGDIEDPEIIRDIPITTVGDRPVYVRDVATISTGVERSSTLSRVSISGTPSENAFTFNVYKRAGGDITQIASNIRAKIAELQHEGGALADSQALLTLDLGKEVSKSLRELITAGFETVFLVVASLLLTIGWRESLVAALSIPLSFVIAFIGLQASGNTINFVSLFSLILAVGILVDSGIVVTEAIHTRMRKFINTSESKDAALAAAYAAISEYAWPLIAGTMTTVAVFVPLFFISGVVGEFIKSIPFTIIFVLMASIFVALALVPLIAIKLTKATSSNAFEERQEEWTHRAQTWYERTLRRFLLNKRYQTWFLTLLIVGLGVSFALAPLGLLKAIFFPGEDVNYVYLEVEAKRGTPLRETDLTLRAIEEVLYEKEYVKSFSTTAGAGSAFTQDATQGGGSGGGALGNVSVELFDKEERTRTSAEVVADLRMALGDIRTADIRIVEQAGGPPTGAPILVKFFGDDLGELARVAESAQGVLESIPGTTDITASTRSIGTEFVITIDTAKAAERGLTSRDVAQGLRTAVFGSTATTLRVDGDDIDVVVKLALDQNFTDPTETTNVPVDTLRNISIQTRDGNVLLGSIVSESIQPSNTVIAHEGGRRTESVSAYTAEGTLPADVVNVFQARTSELGLTPDMTVSYGGETEDVNRSFTEMFFALIAGLVLMLAILVLSFNSLRYSLYLLAIVPLSLIGVLDGLAITGQPISFTSLLGVVALAGVIINHAIILMDSMLVYQKQMSGAPALDVVVKASVSRLRPIFLTTITTVLGMIPLARISDFWSPLAFTIMFGLSFAMILTLVLIPTIVYRHQNGDYLWMRRFAKNLFWHWPRRALRRLPMPYINSF